MSRIGIFDSGAGGLSVARVIMEYLPDADIVYFGDSKNLPYGDKSLEQLKSYSKNAIEFLEKHQVDIIIAACGTISSNCLDYAKSLTTLPIFDIVSCIADLIDETHKKIAIMATSKTIDSGLHKNLILEKYPLAEVVEIKCPKLLPLIEGQQMDGLKNALHEYLSQLDGADAIVLGCTHYPLVTEVIEQVLETLGLSSQIIDPAYALVKKLPKRELLFFTSGDDEKFQKMLDFALQKGKN